MRTLKESQSQLITLVDSWEVNKRMLPQRRATECKLNSTADLSKWLASDTTVTVRLLSVRLPDPGRKPDTL